MGDRKSLDEVSAAQLPDVRSRLVDELTSVDPCNPAVQVYALHASTRSQIPADPRILDPYRQAELLARNERERLVNASLYWVSPAMSTLTLAAAPGMPPFRPTPQDLPAAYGLIYFAAPISEFTESPVIEEILFSDGSVQKVSGDSTYRLCAATWGPYDCCGTWRQGGLWFSFYTGERQRHLQNRVLTERPGIDPLEAEAIARRVPPIGVDNEAAVSAVHDRPGDDPLFEIATETDTTAYWLHLVLTAFRLMQTSRAAHVTDQRPVRHVRRRAGRVGVVRPDESVQLVDVTARPRPVRLPDGDGRGDMGRQYRVRWVVEGHWRNQYYPRANTHRPRYIDSYIKGPDNAPLKVKQRVHIWRDPSEVRREPSDAT